MEGRRAHSQDDDRSYLRETHHRDSDKEYPHDNMECPVERTVYDVRYASQNNNNRDYSSRDTRRVGHSQDNKEGDYSTGRYSDSNRPLPADNNRYGREHHEDRFGQQHSDRHAPSQDNNRSYRADPQDNTRSYRHENSYHRSDVRHVAQENNARMVAFQKNPSRTQEMMRNTIMELETRILELEKENTTLEDDKTFLKNKKIELESRNFGLQRDYVEMEDKTSSLKNEISDLQKRNAAFLIELDSVPDRREMGHLIEKNKRLQEENTKLEMENSKLEERALELEEKNVNVGKELLDQRGLERDIQDEREKLRAERQRTKALESKLRALEKDLLHEKKKAESLEREHAKDKSLEVQLKGLEKQLEAERKSTKSLLNQQRKTTDIMSQAKSKMTALAEKNAKLEEEKRTLEQEIQQVQHELSELADTKGSNPATHIELEREKTKNYTLEKKLADLKEDNSVLGDKEADLEEKNASLKKQIDSLLDKEQEEKEAHFKLEKENSKLEKENTKLEAANILLEEGQTTLIEENYKYIKTIQHWKSKHKALQEKQSVLEELMSKMKGKYAELRDKQSKSEEANEAVHARLGSKEKQIESMAKQHRAMKQIVLSVQNQLKNFAALSGPSGWVLSPLDPGKASSYADLGSPEAHANSTPPARKRANPGEKPSIDVEMQDISPGGNPDLYAHTPINPLPSTDLAVELLPDLPDGKPIQRNLSTEFEELQKQERSPSRPSEHIRLKKIPSDVAEEMGIPHDMRKAENCVDDITCEKEDLRESSDNNAPRKLHSRNVTPPESQGQIDKRADLEGDRPGDKNLDSDKFVDGEGECDQPDERKFESGNLESDKLKTEKPKTSWKDAAGQKLNAKTLPEKNPIAVEQKSTRNSVTKSPKCKNAVPKMEAVTKSPFNSLSPQTPFLESPDFCKSPRENAVTAQQDSAKPNHMDGPLQHLCSSPARSSSLEQQRGSPPLKRRRQETVECLLNAEKSNPNSLDEDHQKEGQTEFKCTNNETKCSENKTKCSGNETKLSEHEPKFTERAMKFSEKQMKFSENETKLRESETKFPDVEMSRADMDTNPDIETTRSTNASKRTSCASEKISENERSNSGFKSPKDERPQSSKDERPASSRHVSLAHEEGDAATQNKDSVSPAKRIEKDDQCLEHETPSLGEETLKKTSSHDRRKKLVPEIPNWNRVFQNKIEDRFYKRLAPRNAIVDEPANKNTGPDSSAGMQVDSPDARNMDTPAEVQRATPDGIQNNSPVHMQGDTPIAPQVNSPDGIQVSTPADTPPATPHGMQVLDARDMKKADGLHAIDLTAVKIQMRIPSSVRTERWMDVLE